MSAAGAYLGWQPVAMGLLDGTAAPAAFVGETIGFGAVTDTGAGDWTIAVEPEVGLPATPTAGGVNIICSPMQRAAAAGSSVVALIVSAIAIDVNAWDLAVPGAVDCITGLLIIRWPN